MAGKSRKYIYFDAKAYINVLKQELKKAVKEVRDLLQDRITMEAKALPLNSIKTVYYKGRKIKQHEIHLANGGTTSDAQRKSALLKSIVSDQVKWESDNILRTAVRAMANNFKESHIGWYYEYGTGKRAENLPVTAYRIAAAGIRAHTPHRYGREIVTRSIHDNGGTWIDMGGNLRISHSPRGGETDEGFRKYIGDDVEAYHWYRTAYLSCRDDILQIYGKAIKEVHPGKFFKVMPRIVLGRD
jgi:hypothetical protein